MFCFVCVCFLTVCRAVLVFFKCLINLTIFSFKSTSEGLFLDYYLFIYFLLLLFFLIKQLFLHEMVNVSRLFCLFVLFLQLKLLGNNPQVHYLFPFPKRFTMFFIYFHLNLSLQFILKFTFFFRACFIMNLIYSCQ